MTSELINLNKARKARDKAAVKAEATQNRVRFGRTKGQASAAKAAQNKLVRTLDEAKRER